MKSLMLVTVMVAAAIGVAQMQASTWTPSDARPEAVMTGGTLLMIAAVLRGVIHRRTK